MRRLLAAALLLLAAAAPPPPKAKPAPAAKIEDVAEQLAMLTFDANPAWAIPARTTLGRWAGPMHLFLFGRPTDRQDAQAAARALSRPAGLSIRVLTEADAARTPPNTFLVVDENLPLAFRGPLRDMLANAFLDNQTEIETFIAAVVDREPCWTLPVWTDASRRVLKAAVIGVDANQPRPALQSCLTRALGAALGLMGPGAFLPTSAFAPGPGTARLSREDDRMLRTLYGKALRPGMTREETQTAARKALAAPTPRMGSAQTRKGPGAL